MSYLAEERSLLVRNLLIVMGILAYATVVPWAAMGGDYLLVPAVFVATTYFVCGMSTGGPAFMAGIFMFVGVQSAIFDVSPGALSGFALLGGMLALPFALMTDDI